MVLPQRVPARRPLTLGGLSGGPSWLRHRPVSLYLWSRWFKRRHPGAWGRSPRSRHRLAGEPLVAPAHPVRHPRVEAVGPRRLHELAADVRIAGLGDPSPPGSLTTGVLRGNQTAEPHE